MAVGVRYAGSLSHVCYTSNKPIILSRFGHDSDGKERVLCISDRNVGVSGLSFDMELQTPIVLFCKHLGDGEAFANTGTILVRELHLNGSEWPGNVGKISNPPFRAPRMLNVAGPLL